MQTGEQELYAPERVLLIMPSREAPQLIAALRMLGAQSCELAHDHEALQRCCAELQPELVLIDAHGPEALPLAAALRELTRAPFVYLCDAEAEPLRELMALCSTALERPVTHARLRRCLSALAGFGAADRVAGLLFQGEVFASLVHELRAPLQGVSGFARYVLDGKAGALADEQATCLQQVELGTQHVLQLIQATLDLTDRNVATRELQNAVVDTKQTLRELVQALQPLANKRRVVLSVLSAEHVPEVVSDASKLKQVLYNLLSTSLQHAAGASTLSISMLPAGTDALCMEVRGNGPGLTRAQLEQLNSTNLTEDSAGALYLTRRMLAALGGSLHAFNDQASGAVIRLELPLRPSSARPYLRSV